MVPQFLRAVPAAERWAVRRRMTVHLEAPDRAELRELLLRWQRGEITFYEVVEEVEAIEERVWPDVDVIDFPPDDPRSLPTEIVSIISMGHVAPLLADDIPLLLECLNAPPQSEAEALERLWTRLETPDHERRAEEFMLHRRGG